MTEQTFNRRSLALAQLAVAFRLFASNQDLLAAITLAGAAEELLGKIARERGITTSVESRAQAAVEIDFLFGLESTVAQHISHANKPRNALKHLGDGDVVRFDPLEEAADILQRATDNFWLVEQSLTPEMEAFERGRRAS